ncbi:MAG TPA: pitrilysin family protein [Bacteroidota bacterium]|nr:pitrilysin family protein [Bacteroidota bacterium]
MKFRWSLFIAFLTCATVPVFAAAPESFVLNGLKVIVKQNTTTDIISAVMCYRGGAAVLTSREAGIEKFALAVAVKASEQYPKEKLNATLERMNTTIGSSVSADYSTIDLQCVKQYFDTSWNVFADVILHPAVTKEDVELERQQLLSQLKQTHDNPDSYLDELGRRAFYTDHPYQTDANGEEATVASFTPEQLKAYLAKRTSSTQLLLIVVGNVTRDRVEKLVKASFGSLPAGVFAAPVLPAVNHDETSVKFVYRNLPTNYIEGYFSAPSLNADDYYAMAAAGAVLQYRLFEEVRTKRSLSYAPAGGIGRNFSNYGFIYVTALKPDTTLKVMMAELKKMARQKISTEELRNTVNTFITTYYLRNETNRSQANILARYELSGAGYQAADKLIDDIKKVTPDDIQNACKKYIKNLQFVIIGNSESLEIKDLVF